MKDIIKARIKINDDIIYKGKLASFDDLKEIMDALKIKFEGKKGRRS
jgi:hypothetical protein